MLEKLIDTHQYGYNRYRYIIYLGLIKSIEESPCPNLWEPLLGCALGQKAICYYIWSTDLDSTPLYKAMMMGRWRCLRKMADNPLFRERAKEKLREETWRRPLDTNTQNILRSEYGIEFAEEGTRKSSSSSSDSDFDKTDTEEIRRSSSSESDFD